MQTNDVLRRVRYIFDFSDSKMIELFSLGDLEVSREQVSSWLKRDEDPEFETCSDVQLAIFLNGLITEKRGKKEGKAPEPEAQLNNNIVLRKLMIALSMKSEDALKTMKAADLWVSKHELSAFFRKPGHRSYRECKDQILRNFLIGLATQHRVD